MMNQDDRKTIAADTAAQLVTAVTRKMVNVNQDQVWSMFAKFYVAILERLSEDLDEEET